MRGMVLNMAQSNFDTALYDKLDAYIDGLPSKQGALVSVLHEAQGIFKYLPIEVQTHIAHKLDIPASKVYGVVTFYSYFTMTKKGDFEISVCMGTACYVRGAGKVLDKFAADLNVPSGTTSEDGRWTLNGLRCVGACGLAPVVLVNGKVYGRIEEKDVQGIIDEYKDKEVEA